MTIAEDIDLLPLTAFKLGPRARYFITLKRKEDVPEAVNFARKRGLPYFVLGSGSNTIFTAPEVFDSVVLKMAIPGFKTEGTALYLGAGEVWDEVVAQSVNLGLSGIEAMSAIPGSVGAAPIQNIGAYGQEVDRVVESVDAYDTKEDRFTTLPREACEFSYRDSRFKREGRYIITGLTLRLSTAPPSIPNYADPIAYFAERGINDPSLAQIRRAVIQIRKRKLPDPREVASVGSFFKNPFVDAEFVERARREWPRTVIFPMPDGRFKAGAGWMLEMLGYKGKSFGTLSIYEHHAMVLVNNGGATSDELMDLIAKLTGDVRRRFAVDLEPEPIFA